MMDCLDEMVGILPPGEDCPCLTLGIPEETLTAITKVSPSNLYLENLEGGAALRHVKAASGDCRDWAELALKARRTAVQTVKNDLILKINDKFTKSKEKYVGTLGYQSFSRPYTPSGNIVGQRIRPSSANTDSQMVVNGIAIATFTPVTTTVRLYKTPVGGSYGTLLGQWPVTTVANTFTSVTGFTQLTLPLSEGGQPLEYYVLYDRGGIMPMDVQPTCNCPGVNALLNQFVTVQGVETDSFINLPGIESQFTAGVSVNVILQCKMDGLVCRNQFDEEDPVSLVLAYSILFKAAEYLLEYIANSGNINRLTMMEKTNLWGKRNHFLAMYAERMQYIEDGININASDCFICKEVQEGMPTVVDILA